MLDAPNGERMTDIPRRRRTYHERRLRDCERRLRNMSGSDYFDVVATLNRIIDGQETVHSSQLGARWLPRREFLLVREAAGPTAHWFFGLLLWQVMMDRPENWGFVRATRGIIYRRL